MTRRYDFTTGPTTDTLPTGDAPTNDSDLTTKEYVDNNFIPQSEGVVEDFLDFTEVAAPASPSAGSLRVFAKSDKKLWTKNSDGIESQVGSGSGGGSFNYVTNPSAETDAETGVTVASSGFTVTRGTTEATFSDHYFEIDGNTTINKTVDWSLDTLQQKHHGQLMRFSARVKLALDSGSSGVYKIGVHDGSAYLSGTELTLTDGANTLWEALFPLDTAETYTVRLECTTAGDEDDVIYVDDVTISPELTVAGPSGTPWKSRTPLVADFDNSDDLTLDAVSYFRWRESGEAVEIDAYYVFSSDGTSSGNFAVSKATLESIVGATLTTERAIGSVEGIKAGTGAANIICIWSGSEIFFYSDSQTSAIDGNEFGTTSGRLSQVRYRIVIPVPEWAGSVTTYQNSGVEYASVGGTWDAASTTTVYGPSGQAMGGALTAGRLKTITWQNDIKSTDIIQVQFSQDQVNWFDAVGARIGPSEAMVLNAFNAAGTNASGVSWYKGAAANQTIVRFEQHMNMANDDSPAVDWPSSEAYWRVVKCSNPIGIGTGLATATQPGAVTLQQLPPSGSVSMFAGATAPAGWLLCDGSAISRASYADLFAAIGTTWGVGDGSTTFNIPNLVGKFVRGADGAGPELGATQGDATAVNGLSATGTFASSSHTHSDGSLVARVNPGSENQLNVDRVSTSTWTAEERYTGLTSSGSGGGQVSGAKVAGNTGTPSATSSPSLSSSDSETRPANVGLHYIIKT